jgi:hypothetical protein
MPPTRCPVTMAGLSSSVTVHLPNRPCRMTTATSVSASSGDWRRTWRRRKATAGDYQDHQPEKGGDIAVDHFAPGLAQRDRSVFTALLLNGLGDFLAGMIGGEVAIAPRPVGTAQAGIGEPHPGTQHHQAQRQDQREAEQARQRAAGRTAIGRPGQRGHRGVHRRPRAGRVGIRRQHRSADPRGAQQLGDVLLHAVRDRPGPGNASSGCPADR